METDPEDLLCALRGAVIEMARHTARSSSSAARQFVWWHGSRSCKIVIAISVDTGDVHVCGEDHCTSRGYTGHTWRCTVTGRFLSHGRVLSYDEASQHGLLGAHWSSSLDGEARMARWQGPLESSDGPCKPVPITPVARRVALANNPRVLHGRCEEAVRKWVMRSMPKLARDIDAGTQASCAGLDAVVGICAALWNVVAAPAAAGTVVKETIDLRRYCAAVIKMASTQGLTSHRMTLVPRLRTFFAVYPPDAKSFSVSGRRVAKASTFIRARLSMHPMRTRMAAAEVKKVVETYRRALGAASASAGPGSGRRSQSGTPLDDTSRKTPLSDRGGGGTKTPMSLVRL